MSRTSRLLHIGVGAVLLAAIIVGGNLLDDHYLKFASMVCVTIAFAACLTFVIRYHVSTHGAWAQSAVGRNVMLLMACLAGALGFILSAYLFEQYPFRRSIGIGVYLTIAYAAWRRVILQFRAQSQLHAPTPDRLQRRRASDRREER